MQVLRKDQDPLNINVTLIFEPADYADSFNAELKKYKNKAQLKGFRKGMTPMGVIKKMYGKSILADIVNKLVQDKLFGYLDEQQLNYLGQPLPNFEETPETNLDINELQPLTFSFDLGLAPEFDIKGISDSDIYTLYDIQITEDDIDKEIESARRRMGKSVNATDNIQQNDMLKISASELEDGLVKENGWNTEFKILVDVIKDETVKNDVLTKKQGDQFVFDPYKLEDKDDQYTEKYILNKSEENEQEIGRSFLGTITEVSRIEPAEMDEDFFKSFGSEEIIDESSLRDFLKNDFKAYYDEQAKKYMFREIMDVLMDQNDIQLPDAFMKRYLKESTENITDEQIEMEYGAFSKNLRWNLQKSKLAKEFDLNVVNEEIKNHLSQKIFSFMRQYGNMDYSMFGSMVDKMMKDKEQVNTAYEEILADKIFEKIDTIIQKNLQSVTKEDFSELVKALNERVNNS